jgi:hypothetical protein
MMASISTMFSTPLFMTHLSLDPGKTALVAIDLQNAITAFNTRTFPRLARVRTSEEVLNALA